MTDLPKRYLKNGAATNVHVHSVRSLGTDPDQTYGDQVESFEVLEHGGPLNFPMVQTYTPDNEHARKAGIVRPLWEVESAMGWLHVTGPAYETHQTFDGIARRLCPEYRYIGQERAWGYDVTERVTRAYTLYPERVCGGETGTHDERCGRHYGHAGPCDWAD